MPAASDLHSGMVASSARTKQTVMRRRGRAGYVRTEGTLASSARPGEHESTPCELDALMIPVASGFHSGMVLVSIARTKQTARRRGGRAGTVRSDGAPVSLTQLGEYESTTSGLAVLIMPATCYRCPVILAPKPLPLRRSERIAKALASRPRVGSGKNRA
jgi:hypothetical protein